jgi:hypothetical protein
VDFISLALVKEGGPWALLLTVLAAVSFLVWRGVLIPGPLVDKAMTGYVESNGRLEKELEFWRTAATDKDLTIRAQADQLQKLMAYSAVGTHALEDILKEARKRDVDA